MDLWQVRGTYAPVTSGMDGLVPAWYVDPWPRGKQLPQRLIKPGFWTATEENYRFLNLRGLTDAARLPGKLPAWIDPGDIL